MLNVGRCSLFAALRNCSKQKHKAHIVSDLIPTSFWIQRLSEKRAKSERKASEIDTGLIRCYFGNSGVSERVSERVSEQVIAPQKGNSSADKQNKHHGISELSDQMSERMSENMSEDTSERRFRPLSLHPISCSFPQMST